MQEVIDLLEKAVRNTKAYRSVVFWGNPNFLIVSKYDFNQALAKLQEVPEPTSLGKDIRKIAKSIRSETDRNIINQAADRLDAWWNYIEELQAKRDKCDDCVYLIADSEIINEHIEKEKILEKTIQELQSKIAKLVDGQQAKTIAES